MQFTNNFLRYWDDCKQVYKALLKRCVYMIAAYFVMHFEFRTAQKLCLILLRLTTRSTLLEAVQRNAELTGGKVDHGTSLRNRLYYLLFVVNSYLLLAKKDLNYFKKFLANATISDPNHLIPRMRGSSLICLPHMGDHVSSMLLIASLFKNTNVTVAVIVAQQNERLEECFLMLSKMFKVNIIHFDIHSISFLKIVRLLKNKNMRMVAFYDLSPQISHNKYESLRACTLFRKNAHITDGVFRIAAMSKTDVFFAVGGLNERGFTLRFLTQDNSKNIEHLFATGVAILEGCVKKKPEHWYYLRYMQTYFHVPTLLFEKKLEHQRQLLSSLQKKLLSS